MRREVSREVIKHLMNLPEPSSKDVNVAKMKIAQEYDLNRILPNSEIINHLKPDERRKLISVLRRKSVRTISGVSVIAVMTKPWPCPKKAPCAYCPGGPHVGAPQSYTGREPAAMRGLQNNFDPYEQVKSRMMQLEAIGHVVDKVELIVMGGTFPAMPLGYQERFVKGCLDAINSAKSGSLDEAKGISEHSPVHNVGITVETRPDWSGEQHVDHMLSMGVTRVELGVQNIYDDIYEVVNRGHTVQDVADATRILRDSGLKVAYHLMPGLPGSSFERDLDAFKKIFADERFKPDMIKIYPCLVVEGTRMYDWWKRGIYEPYTTEEAVRIVLEIKKFVPEWVRIMRVQRDIPAYLIEAGVKKSNLRQIALRRLRELGLRCRCIRCREVGHRRLKDKVEPDLDKVEILTRSYEASRGKEFFISAEDAENDVLIGYLRLRFPSNEAHRPEISGQTASLIRELRVCGSLVPVGHRFDWAYQHRGLGALLLRRSEEISRAHGFEKMVVTAALGTKRYYERFGYRREGPYMSKLLT